MQTWRPIQEDPTYCCATILDSHFKLDAFISKKEANKVRQEITELMKKTSTAQLTQDNQDGTQSSALKKKSLFSFKRQPLQTVSPQSSEKIAYLAELTLEETNNTLQF